MCKQNLFILAFVHSSPNNVKERNQIRLTWGGDKTFNGKDFRTVFMLGDPLNSTIQRIIVEEARKYKDIVQGDFKDSYRNLTYKHIMGLSWTIRNCPNVRYILKTDDDTMVNVFNMMEYLNFTEQNKNFLYCSIFTVQTPFRFFTKWLVSILEYPFAKYPYYCQGFAYLMTPDVAEKLLNASECAKMFWIDDVYVTGILNVYANVPFLQMTSNHSFTIMKKENLGASVKNVMFILSRKKRMRESWNTAWNSILKYSRG
ncbi:hypothetical protein LOTGIDRAFT_116475 [Lottia gigantea]|uniref:Hexosyltransferase n=1 Tax=Lottia gigantea TaxID=225164 RepID=V4AM00_LOTGI|nr:hypothetical protein LOTGIDRAFT_116475 [Lottia gigantea]ESO95790.1 hypothetical protein LOTGIDRAFT_116475 [Lottia gigantea]